MCGIFGVVLFDKSNSDFFKIKSIVRKLALESKTRGRSATGISVASKTGISILKHNISSDVFIKTPEFRRLMNDQLPRKRESGTPYSIIGHTRHPTKGSEKVHANNHPIEAGTIVGVHNGVINNDDALFKNTRDFDGKQMHRMGEVDSEIIFRLINMYSNTNKTSGLKNNNSNKIYNPTSLAIIDASIKLRGSYACAVQDSNNTKMLWLFRNTSPIAIYYYPFADIMIFASVGSFIENSTHNIDLGDPEILAIDQDTCMCLNIKERKYNMVNLQKNDINTKKIGYMG